MGTSWPSRPGKGHVSPHSCSLIPISLNPRLPFTFHSLCVPFLCHPQTAMGSWNSKKQAGKRDMWKNKRLIISKEKTGAFKGSSQVRKIAYWLKEGVRDLIGGFVECSTEKRLFQNLP